MQNLTDAQKLAILYAYRPYADSPSYFVAADPRVLYELQTLRLVCDIGRATAILTEEGRGVRVALLWEAKIAEIRAKRLTRWRDSEVLSETRQDAARDPFTS